MDRLRAILEHKRTEIDRLRPERARLRRRALARDEHRGFRRALDRGPGSLGLIAEAKRASPSAGRLVEQFDPAAIARAYETGGAHAISVLTDKRFFQGCLGHLRTARAAVELPVLRKDFILDDTQVYESAAAGADAILLIVAALEQDALHHLLEVAHSCQLDALVEIHTQEELDRALETDTDMIGINNRNLTTFKIDLDTTRRLAEQVPEEVLLVSESGIRRPADVRKLKRWGANAILVGETLMRSANPTDEIGAMLRAGATPD